MNLTGLYAQKRIIIYWRIFHSSSFHHICNIKYRLDCRYSTQNIFNAKNFNPHKKPISLLNVPICTQGMQRTSLDLIDHSRSQYCWLIQASPNCQCSSKMSLYTDDNIIYREIRNNTDHMTLSSLSHDVNASGRAHVCRGRSSSFLFMWWSTQTRDV